MSPPSLGGGSAAGSGGGSMAMAPSDHSLTTMSSASSSRTPLDMPPIAQKRSSSSIHTPSQSQSHRAQSSISLSTRANYRESSQSLATPGGASPSSHHAMQSSPMESTASYPGSTSMVDTTQMLISSAVQRLIRRLPFNSGTRLTFLEEDDLVRSCVANLVTVSRTQLPTVAKELMTAMETLNRSAQAFSEDQISVNLLQSQLLVLRVMTSCMLYHWRCCQEVAPPQAPPEGAPSEPLPMAWVDPDPLGDQLAKQILSVMTVTLRQTVAREDRQINAWAGISASTSGTQAGAGRAGGMGSAARSAMRDWDQTASFGSVKQHHRSDEQTMSRDESIASTSSATMSGGGSSSTPGPAVDSEGIPVAALSLVNGVSLFVLPPGCPPALAPFEVPSPGCPELGGPERPQRFKPLAVIGGTQEGFGSAGLGEDMSKSVPALTKAIYRYANLVIFYLSSSNWQVVSARIKNRIAYLITTPEEFPNAADLRLIECGNLDPRRLNTVFQELTSAFHRLRKSTQNTASLIVRRTVWAFIQYNPIHFATLYQTNGRLEGNPEVLFDQAYSLTEGSKRKPALWPMLTALLILCPDTVAKVVAANAASRSSISSSAAKKASFIDALRKALKTGKYGDIAAVCAMDICKAATYTPPNSNSGLRMLVPEFERELKERILDPQKPMLNSAKQIETSLIVDGFISFFRLDPKKSLQQCLPIFIADSSPTAFKVGLLKAILQLVSESLHIPWNPRIEILFPSTSPWMRRTFKDVVYRLLREGRTQQQSGRRGIGATTSKAGSSSDDMQGRLQLVHAILCVWKADPRTASHGLSFNYSTSLASLSPSKSVTDMDQLLQGAMQTDSVLALIFMICRATFLPGFPEIHGAALDVLHACHRPQQAGGHGHGSDHPDEHHETFLLHARRTLHSAEAVLNQKISEQVVRAPDAVEQRHWYRLWLSGLQLQASNAIAYSAMTNEEKLETPRPSFIEKLLERLVLSIGFFLGICSADTEVVTMALGSCASVVTLRKEARKVGDMAKALGDDWSVFWEKLTDPSFMTLGRVARQKRIRVLLRNIKYPTPAALITWKEILRRWSVLTSIVAKPIENGAASESVVDERVAAQWDNYAGFLASLSGCFMGAAPGDLPALPESMLDPDFALPADINQLIESFLQEMVDLLVSDSVWVREKVKETLGLDLNVRLSGALFRQIHAVLGDFFDKSTGLPQPSEMFTIFVEQSISVVQMVLNRIDAECTEWTSSVDIGSLMVLYVEYVNALGRREQALRIKASMCQLCGALMAKRAMFAFRNELRVRNRLFQALITWTSDSPVGEDGKVSGKIDRLQRELDIASLRIISTLLDGLPLLLADDALMLDEKVEWAKSRQFSLFSSIFIRILNRARQHESSAGIGMGSSASLVDRSRGGQLLSSAALTAQRNRELVLKETAPLRESAILALSNLLASNIDSGLQHSLILGYSEDPELRTAFMRIMTNVLNQGTAFDPLERLKESQKQNRLVELVGDRDLSLALAICQVCRGWDPELGIDRIILSIFDSRGGIIKFLKAAVEEEIESTASEEMVFRSNSFRTHLLSLFARTHGYDYLRSIMTPLITEMANKPRGYSFEIDPQRLEPGESAMINQARLEETAQSFINTICDSAAQVPAVMRELCRHIRIVMDRKFPNSRYQGVGGFMFLRFISPAIVAPQNIDMNLDGPGKALRRGLLLVSKILQTLASNNLFSAHKEPFMIGLNDFLRSNVWRVTTFLDGISDARTDPERLHAADQPLGYGIHPSGYGIDEREQRALHQWLLDNTDKVGNELLARASTTSSVTTDALGQVGPGISSPGANMVGGGKAVYDQLKLTLADLGPPGKGATASDAGTSNAAGMGLPPGQGTQALQDFYRRTGARNLHDNAYDKLFYVGPVSKAGRPVVYYCPNLQDAETIDFEGFMAHTIQTLEQLRGQEFDVVCDMTALKKSNLMPPAWAFYFASIVPLDIASKLRGVIMFNPNTAVRLWYESARAFPESAYSSTIGLVAQNVQIHHCNSLGELDSFIERRNVALCPQTLAITSAVAEHRFTQVTMVWYYRQLIPVTFKIGGEYLQITALKGTEFFAGRAANANDVFHLADIDDVRSLSNRGDDNTFLLTVRASELSFLFHSRERLNIVQALREARARVSRIRPTKSLDRTLLPSDVPGTLLNMAMLNITSEHPGLRLSAYNLLCALSGSFNFGASAARRKLLNSKGLSLPANTTNFVVDLSRDFAVAAPGATLEFFVSFFEGFEAASPNQKTMSLQYMAPWLSNLVMFTHASREEQPEFQRRIKEIFGQLLAITTKQADMFAVMQRTVWCHVSKLDDLIPLVLDVFCEAAIDSGLYSPRFDAVIDTMVSFSSMNLRGKLLARLRRAIGKTSHNPTVASLHENAAWKEIATLTRMNMVMSFTAGRLEALLYLPEVLHIVLLLAGNGADATRYAIRGTAINLIHSLCTEDRHEVAAAAAGGATTASLNGGGGGSGGSGGGGTVHDKEGLAGLLERLTGDESAPLFGLPQGTDGDAYALASSDMVRPPPDSDQIARLAELVYEIAELAAPTVDTANSWRARLTSLVTSKAFQYNPIVQARAFVLLGCLARGEIEDDLLYQILVSLRGSITEWANLGNDAPMISIVSCLGKVVTILPPQSRYLAQMFWLGVAMVQSGHVPLFKAGVELMQSTVTTLEERKVAEAQETDLMGLLTTARAEEQDAADRLDAECGVDFEGSFSFYLAALLVKGLRHPSTKTATSTLLRSLLRATASAADGSMRSSEGRVHADQLGFLVGLLPNISKAEDYGELLGLAGVPADVCQEAAVALAGTQRWQTDGDVGASDGNGFFKYLDIPDNKTALLAVALVCSLLLNASSESERLILFTYLADASRETPAILSILYNSLAPSMREILINSQLGPIVDAVQTIAQAAIFEPVFAAQATETARRGGPDAFLEEAGFSCLLKCGSFGGPLTDARRLVLAKLSTALLASLLDAAAV